MDWIQSPSPRVMNGRRQGVPKSSPQPVVDAEERPAGQPSMRETAEEAVAEDDANREETSDIGTEQQEEDSSVEEDDPLLQELRKELDPSTFWQSGSAQRLLTEETTQPDRPPSPSQSYGSRIAVLMDRMEEDQMNRFEAFRRSTLSRANMKKLVSSLVSQTLSDEKVNIVLCSLGKMFVGDLIETARRIANEEKHVGALTRSHVFQAHRVLCKKNKVTKRRTGRFFRNL